jgi:pyridoxamine 5'-phosphate oxidase
MSSLPPWRSPLSRALHRNRSSPDSRYVQLATIDTHQRPSNRTIVFRGFHDPDSQLQFVTDIRSSKAQHIAQNPWSEACWYFSKTREQFRIAGQLQLITAHSLDLQPARRQAWQQLSSGSREQFAWPLPAAPRAPDPQAFAVAPPDLDQPLPNFGLLLLVPITVDHLELRGEPQNRWRYHWDDEWSITSINP